MLSNTDQNIALKLTNTKYPIVNMKVTIDNKLNFNEHVSGVCKKASQKLRALARE